MRVSVARTAQSRWSGVALGLVLGVCGCSLPTRITGINPQIPAQSTPVVIDEGLRKLDEAETKRRIARMMASPEMKAVEQELIAGLVDGSLSALDDEERAARLSALTTRYLHGIARSAVSGALDGAMSEEQQRAWQRFTASLIATSVAQVKQSLEEAKVGDAVSSTLTEQLGPAMETVFKENFGPGLAAVLASEEVTRALGTTAHVVGRELVLGAHEALSEIQDKDAPPESSSLLSRLSNLTRKGTQLVSTLTWVVGAVAVALALWVTKLLSHRKRTSAQSEKRAATMRLLSEAIQLSKGKPWSHELIEALEERLRDEDEVESTLYRRRTKSELEPEQ